MKSLRVFEGSASKIIKLHRVKHDFCLRSSVIQRLVDPITPKLTRRSFLVLPLLSATVLSPSQSQGVSTIPPGYRVYRDILDGYQFLVKDDWIPVTSTGNDVAFRNLSHPDQNLFVNISSPSTSRFTTIGDVGSPQEVGERILRQYLTEFMSTRLGVIRQADFVSSKERLASDGKSYYDIEVVMRSYASRSQLAVTQEEVRRDVELEWERKLLTVIGVANQRKYEFRLQSDINANARDLETLEFMANSFRCTEV